MSPDRTDAMRWSLGVDVILLAASAAVIVAIILTH